MEPVKYLNNFSQNGAFYWSPKILKIKGDSKHTISAQIYLQGMLKYKKTLGYVWVDARACVHVKLLSCFINDF